MSHTLSVNGAVFEKIITVNNAQFALVRDPQNSGVEIYIPKDRRYYKGLQLNFEGQIVSVGWKYIRVQPSIVTFYGD